MRTLRAIVLTALNSLFYVVVSIPAFLAVLFVGVLWLFGFVAEQVRDINEKWDSDAPRFEDDIQG